MEHTTSSNGHSPDANTEYSANAHVETDRGSLKRGSHEYSPDSDRRLGTLARTEAPVTWPDDELEPLGNRARHPVMVAISLVLILVLVLPIVVAVFARLGI